MNKKDIKAIIPRELGWFEYKLNSQEMDYVWRCIKNKKEDCKEGLAGNISGSYDLHDMGNWFWMNTIKPLVKRYGEEFVNMGDTIAVSQKHPYYMSSWG